jgi:hypothetical protein
LDCDKPISSSSFLIDKRSQNHASNLIVRKDDLIRFLHHPTNCQFCGDLFHLELSGLGLGLDFDVQCLRCRKSSSSSSSPPSPPLTSTQKSKQIKKTLTTYNINLESVLGTLISGGGNNNCNDMLASLSLPTFGTKYFTIEQFINTKIIDMIKTICKEAMAEEIKLAFVEQYGITKYNTWEATPPNKRTKFLHGLPLCISLDGAWHKRGT